MVLRLDKMSMAERDIRGNIPFGQLDRIAAMYEREALEAATSLERSIAFQNARIIREHIATVRAWQSAVAQLRGVYEAGYLADYFANLIL